MPCAALAHISQVKIPEFVGSLTVRFTLTDFLLFYFRNATVSQSMGIRWLACSLSLCSFRWSWESPLSFNGAFIFHSRSVHYSYFFLLPLEMLLIFQLGTTYPRSSHSSHSTFLHHLSFSLPSNIFFWIPSQLERWIPHVGNLKSAL
jgi:hypothetical protein